MTDETIKLPEPTAIVRRWTSSVTVDIPPRLLPRIADRAPLFTADQVRAAVLEAKAQERERASFLTEADLRLILDKLENYDDCGPSGEGWQSEKLSRLVAKLSVAIRSGHSITETQRAEE